MQALTIKGNEEVKDGYDISNARGDYPLSQDSSLSREINRKKKSFF